VQAQLVGHVAVVTRPEHGPSQPPQPAHGHGLARGAFW
jgi:hypothetical protein